VQIFQFPAVALTLLLCGLGPVAQAQTVTLVNPNFDSIEVEVHVEQDRATGYFSAVLPRSQSWRALCTKGTEFRYHSRAGENDWGNWVRTACKANATYPITDAGYPPDANKRWTAPGDVNWIRSTKGEPVPYQAILGGIEQGGQNNDVALYVCRARHAGGVYPGKLIAGRCNIPYRGRELEIPVYDVAVGDGEWGRAGYRLALSGGQEDSGNTLYVCRVHYLEPNGTDHGYHPGKVEKGKCTFGFGGKEVDTFTDFDLFYAR
jgi:hypothetical protein